MTCKRISIQNCVKKTNYRVPGINNKIASAFVSLKYRDFRFLVMGQFGTSMGLWMDQIARGWLIYEMTGSPFLLGLTGALKAIPMMFLSIFAGAIADRYSRKKLMIMSQSLSAFFNLILAILIVTHTVEVWHVMATALATGIVQAFDQPARSIMISDLVDKKHLNNAISLNSVAFNISRTLGPSLAGIAIAVTGAGGSYFVQAFVYFLTILFTIRISEPHLVAAEIKPGSAKNNIFRDMMEGFRYIKSDKMIVALLAVALIPTLLAQPYQSLMPIFAKDILKVGPEGFGLLLGFTGIGSIAGALFVGTLSKSHRPGAYLLALALAFGVLLVFFAFSPLYALSLSLLVIIGFSQTGYNVLNNTLIQTHAPDELRGRVMGVYFLNRGMMPLGTLLAGAMAGWMGAPYTVGILGASCALLVIILIFAVPNFRHLS